jgi:hypothetical protein
VKDDSEQWSKLRWICEHLNSPGVREAANND